MLIPKYCLKEFIAFSLAILGLSNGLMDTLLKKKSAHNDVPTSLISL